MVWVPSGCKQSLVFGCGWVPSGCKESLVFECDWVPSGYVCWYSCVITIDLGGIGEIDQLNYRTGAPPSTSE